MRLLVCLAAGPSVKVGAVRRSSLKVEIRRGRDRDFDSSLSRVAQTLSVDCWLRGKKLTARRRRQLQHSARSIPESSACFSFHRYPKAGRTCSSLLFCANTTTHYLTLRFQHFPIN
jgi:hypothetical protein